MIAANCSHCKVAFDVTGHTPGSMFQCPRCQQGSIVVPGAAPLTALDPARALPTAPGAADELVEEMPRPAAEARAPIRTRAARGTGGAGAAASRRRRMGEAAAKPAKAPLVPILAGAVVLLGAVGGWFAFSGGDDGGRTAADPAGGPGAPAEVAKEDVSVPEVAAALSPAEKIEAARTALPPTDVAGRLALAAEATGKELADVRARLLREVLLLDPDQAAAREAFGFRRYAGDAQRYQGRWLDEADYALALDAEKIGDFTILSTGTGTDSFRDDARALQRKMQDEFPDAQFDYRYDDGIMPRPYVAALQRGAGVDVDANEKYFGKALGELKSVYFERYQARFDLQEIDEPVAVVIFGSKAGYDNWQKKHPEYPPAQFIGAYYMPALKRLMLWNTGDAAFVGTMFHEGTHQLVHFTCPKGFITPWLQEGFAEYFNGHQVEQEFDPSSGKLVNRYKLGRFLPDRYGSLQSAIRGGSALPLDELVHVDYPRFWRAQQEQADKPEARNLVSMIYAQGWGLIMYLHYAEDGRLKEAFEEYFEHEVKGTASGDVFGEILGLSTEEDWAAFDAKVREWILNELPKV